MTEWKSVIIKKNDTMKIAIQVLESSSLRIVMVADENTRLLGTITDGDIRRALIDQKPMSTLASEIMYNNPSVCRVSDDRESMFALMKARDLLHLPIIDENKKIIGLFTHHHFIENKMYENVVFLMAGGFGKRLYPLTEDVPKPMLKVGSKPILETIISQFINSGFSNFVISTHYKAEIIRNYFGNGSRWGVNISYLYEEEPLGTAGALGLLSKNYTELPVIIMNGDLLTKINFENMLLFHKEHGGVATMGVRKYDFQVPYGIVKSKDYHVHDIIEKPIHKFLVNAGVYILSPDLIKQIKYSEYLDMPKFLQSQINNNQKINMFPIHEYWLDIGKIEEFNKAKADIKDIFND